MKTEPTPHRLCDGDCYLCAAIDNPQVAVLLNALALKFGEEVWHIANKVCPNMTVCPDCRIDDFCHDDFTDERYCAIDKLPSSHATCDVAKTAVAVLDEIERETYAALYGHPPSCGEGLKPAAATDSIKSAPNTHPLTPNTPVSDPADTAEKPDSDGIPAH